MEIRTKINKWDLIKLKSFWTVKETTNKTKRQPTKREKIFSNNAANKRSISKIYKQLTQLNIKEKKNKPNNSIKKWVEDLNKTLHQRSHTDDQEAHERFSVSLIIREK